MNQNNDLIAAGNAEENGQKTQRNIRRHKGIKMKDIIYYRQMGLSCMEIGKILGCSKQSISKRLIDGGKIQDDGGNTNLIPSPKTPKEGKDAVLPQPTPLTPQNTGFVIIRRW